MKEQDREGDLEKALIEHEWDNEVYRAVPPQSLAIEQNQRDTTTYQKAKQQFHDKRILER